MTARELTNVAIKVFAIYVLVHALLTIPSLVQALLMFDESPQDETKAMWLWSLGALSLTLLMIVTMAIWKLANSVLNKVSADSSENIGKTISEPFLLSIFGFYLAFEGLLRFTFSSVSGYMQMNNALIKEGLSAVTIAYLLGYFVQIIIGLTLVLRSHGWAVLLSSLREAGLKSKPSNQSLNKDAQ